MIKVVLRKFKFKKMTLKSLIQRNLLLIGIKVVKVQKGLRNFQTMMKAVIALKLHSEEGVVTGLKPQQTSMISENKVT